MADQGRELISWKFEEMAAQHSILLWHTASQAPWQNGICEKGGGILKAIATAIIKSQSLLGAEDVDQAVQEVVMLQPTTVTSTKLVLAGNLEWSTTCCATLVSA